MVIQKQITFLNDAQLGIIDINITQNGETTTKRLTIQSTNYVEPTTTDSKFTKIYYGSFTNQKDLPTTFAEIQALPYSHSATQGFITDDNKAKKNNGMRSFVFAYPASLGEVEYGKVYDDIAQDYVVMTDSEVYKTTIDEGTPYNVFMWAVNGTNAIKTQIKLND